MTAPSDFSSYWSGVELTSANYSGGAGGTFADLVTGNQDWTVQGATPSFSTPVGSLEGMNFSNDATQSVFRELWALRDLTIVIGWSQSSVSSVARPYVGGTSSASNTFNAGSFDSRIRSFLPVGDSGVSASGTIVINTPHVAAFTFSGTDEKAAVKMQGGSITQTASPTARAGLPNWPQLAIGRHRATYLADTNIRFVHLFAEPLLFSDPDAVDSLLDALALTL